MNTYKITATTARGEILANTIVKASESKARKAFREIYRQGESMKENAENAKKKLAARLEAVQQTAIVA